VIGTQVEFWPYLKVAILIPITFATAQSLHAVRDLSVPTVNREAETKEQTHRPEKLGHDDAPLTVTVFIDLQCPACRKFDSSLERIILENPTKLRADYRYFPLQKHAWARFAAIASKCAADQSTEAYWEMVHYFFKKQKSFTPDLARSRTFRYVESRGNLDTDAWNACIDLPSSSTVIDEDIKLANTLHVNSTPTFFIKGEKFTAPIEDEQLKELLASKAR
jgi:protein-disulfide isomerase